MPVQTRRKPSSAKSSANIDAKAAPNSKGSKKEVKPASINKRPASEKNEDIEYDIAETIQAEPSSKKQRTSASPSKSGRNTSKQSLKATSGEAKDVYQNVIGEIDAYGNVIKSSLLTAHVPSAEKKQDPQKAAKRKAIASEIRRLSVDANAILNDDCIPPTKVKARAVETIQRKERAAKLLHKNVVEQISSIGPNNMKKVLEEKKRRTTRNQPSIVIKKRTSVDSKRIQKKTLKELKQLVSPVNTHDYKPSYVKTKIDVKKAKQEVNAEIIKAANVRQIKRMGSKVKSTLKHSKRQ